MRWLGRIKWGAVCLACAALGGAVEATAIAAGWWQLSVSGQVQVCSVLAVVSAGAWAGRGRGRRAEYAAQHSAAARARILAGIREAVERGEIEVPGGVATEEPTADLLGPPYASRERRSRYGSPMPGGRRRTDPLPRRPRGGPTDAQ